MWYPSPVHQYFDDNGEPLTGGLLYTYINGTSTPKATYSDADLTVENDNPIVLDSRGETGPIFGFGYYKFILHDADDVEVWSADDIYGIGCCSQTVSFVHADLNSGVYTITHEYGKAHLNVTVYDEENRIIIPEYVDGSSTTQILIGFGNITLGGTYTARYGL